MAKKSLPRFDDWEADKLQDAKFLAAAEALEPGYQVARLRILRGITQTQLAEMVGTQHPSIVRLENGSRTPSLSFLNKIALALDARMEIKLVDEVNGPG